MYLTGILSILAVYIAWTICSAVFVANKSAVAAKLSLFWIYAYSPAYNIAFNAMTYSASRQLIPLPLHSLHRIRFLTNSAAFLVELFPYAQRARGISIFQFFGKGAQFFGTNVNPIGLGAIGWKFLLVYCCWIVVEATCIYFLWPETSGRTLEELAFLFEDEELAHQATAAVEKEIHHEDMEKQPVVAEPQEAV